MMGAIKSVCSLHVSVHIQDVEEGTVLSFATVSKVHGPPGNVPIGNKGWIGETGKDSTPLTHIIYEYLLFKNLPYSGIGKT